MKHTKPVHEEPVSPPEIMPELRGVAEGGDVEAFLRLLASIAQRLATQPCDVLELSQPSDQMKRKAA